MATSNRFHEATPALIPVIRRAVQASDRDAIQAIVQSTGFFRPDEVEVAVELIDERLHRGEASGYHFLFAESDGNVVGYACYGPIACTLGSYDLYWIAVAKDWQGRGVGRLLLDEATGIIEQLGGRHIYIETSGRPQYAPTRAFYERCGFDIVATLQDFYDQDDDKVVWRKICGGQHHIWEQDSHRSEEARFPQPSRTSDAAR